MSLTSAPYALSRANVNCPFHDGAATLDLLLAELDPNETTLFDSALDLRSLFAARADAEACIEQLFRVRGLLGGRHYLAFFRVRHWAQRAFRIEVSEGRGAPWLPQLFPLDCARTDEVVNAAFARFGISRAGARARFAFNAQAATPA